MQAVYFYGVALGIRRTVVGPEAIVDASLLEPWILAVLLEEALEGIAQILDPLLWSALCDISHPRKVRALDCVELPS